MRLELATIFHLNLEIRAAEGLKILAEISPHTWYFDFIYGSEIIFTAEIDFINIFSIEK